MSDKAQKFVDTTNIPLEDSDAVAAADVVRNLCCEALVVHQQEIQLPDVANQELLETVGEKMTSLRRERTVRAEIEGGWVVHTFLLLP